MPTIYDIARTAQVSVTTVSNVLNGRYDQMTDKTREKVEQVIETLGYRPSHFGRGLATKKTSLIGFTTTDLVHPVYNFLVGEIGRVCSREGYHLVPIYVDRDDPRSIAGCMSDCEEGRFDGIVNFAQSLPHEHARAVFDDGSPLVAIEQDVVDDPYCDTVMIDNYTGGYVAGEHLIRQGCAKHALFRVTTDTAPGCWEEERVKGYRDALAASGAQVELRVFLAATPLEAYRAFKDAWSSFRMDAAAIWGDLNAAGLLRGVEELGVRVPDELKIASYDDTFARITSPPLTSVRQPLEQAAQCAMRLLLDRIDHPEKRLATRKLVPRLIARDSTGVFKERSELARQIVWANEV